MRKSLAVILLFGAASANAAPLTWTLNDVIFSDGATATGHFTYDADTGAYSSVNIAVSPRGELGVFVYPGTGSIPGASYFLGVSSPNSFELAVNMGIDPIDPGNGFVFDVLKLEFQSALTSSGGVISLSTNSYEYESRSYGPDPGGLILWTENVVSGNVSTVPIPAAVWLFGSSLGLLGWLRRSQPV